MGRSRAALCALALAALAAALLVSYSAAQTASSIDPGPKPKDIPKRWKPWIGEYEGGPPSINGASAPFTWVYIVSERDGYIEFLKRNTSSSGTRYTQDEKFRVRGSDPGVHLLRTDDHGNRGMDFGDMFTPKITPDFSDRAQIVIHPVHPIAEVRSEALASSPPHEDGNFRKPELVELAPLDSAIHLDIRYATTNDFLGTAVYTQARAFMQRPAAEALVRALRKLQPLGYGLLIHDAYRPWYVTKIFWDATPPEGKIFVADPSQGSRHNRGCAVDLTLYDLATGKPIEMPGTYDEMSPRSFPDYPGGTSLQRWHRDLLRRAMESEGFTVYEHEWWHFDYKDWHEYPILNIKFEDLGAGQGLATMH